MNRTLFACITILNVLAYIQLDAQEKRKTEWVRKKNLKNNGQKSLKFGEETSNYKNINDKYKENHIQLYHKEIKTKDNGKIIKVASKKKDKVPIE